MKPDEKLRKIMADLTVPLSEDSTKKEFEFINNRSLFGVAPSDEKVCVNPNISSMLEAEDIIDEKTEFAFMVDVLSHENEHTIVTNENVIKDFSEEYPNKPRTASFVMNIIEDSYVDKRRLSRDRGLKPINRMFQKLWINTQQPITELSGMEKYVTAVAQIERSKNNTTKDFHNETDTDFKVFCAKVKNYIEKIDEMNLQQERIQIGHEIMNLIEERFDNDIPDSMNLPQSISPTNDLEDSENKSGQNPMPVNKPDNQNEQEIKCPECNSTNINEKNEIVPREKAVSIKFPLDTNESWIDEILFIENDEKDIFGHKVITNTNNTNIQDIETPTRKVFEVSNGFEVLEPKNSYDKEEEIEYYSCSDCSHNWVNSE